VTLRPATPLALGGLAALALLLSWQLAVVGALAVVAAVIVDALVARRARGPVERRVPGYVARGTPFPVVARAEPGLATRVKQPQTAAIRVEAREGDGGLETTAVALERGRQALPAPQTRVWGPLGLAGWGGSAGEAQTIEVYPDLPGARRLARAAREGRLHAQARRRGPLGLGTEFESVREYRDDDDVRFVNWRATQRLGRPMSNQFRMERDRDVICLVDCGRLVGAPVGSATRLDVFVDVALAVAAVADDLGDRAGLIAFDDELRRVLTPRRRGARDLLAALHDLEPRGVESDYLRAFAEVGGAKRAFVLILTDLIEPAAAEPLATALPLLVRRHVVAVASVADPGLTAILTTAPRTAAEAYRQVAAVDVDREREAVVARLRAARAQVIEASPEELASACVSAYLAAKARARL
jgi:uncharacterized protein (DUF58 family)